MTCFALAPSVDGIAPTGMADALWLWPAEQRTVTVRFLGGDAGVREKVRWLVDTGWNTASGLQFVWTDGPAMVRVGFAPTGNWSYVGASALLIPEPQPTLNLHLNVWDSLDAMRQAVHHEFGHAAGLRHEHEHPQARIPWDVPAVYAWFAACGWTREMVDAFVLHPESGAGVLPGTYDPASVMHYYIPPELVLDRVRRGGATELSAGDRAFVRRLYGPPPGVVHLPIVRR